MLFVIVGYQEKRAQHYYFLTVREPHPYMHAKIRIHAHWLARREAISKQTISICLQLWAFMLFDTAQNEIHKKITNNMNIFEHNHNLSPTKQSLKCCTHALTHTQVHNSQMFTLHDLTFTVQRPVAASKPWHRNIMKDTKNIQNKTKRNEAGWSSTEDEKNGRGSTVLSNLYATR